jgi:hypothetical protein
MVLPALTFSNQSSADLNALSITDLEVVGATLSARG